MSRLGVISKDVYGEYRIRDIQVNGSWKVNPYPTTHVIIPEHFIDDILKTNGFCDIKLNEEETEIISFTARKKPNMKSSTEFSIERVITKFLLQQEHRFYLMKQGIDIRNIPEDESDIRLFDLCKKCIEYGNIDEVKSKLSHFLLFGELTNDECKDLMRLLEN